MKGRCTPDLLCHECAGWGGGAHWPPWLLPSGSCECRCTAMLSLGQDWGSGPAALTAVPSWSVLELGYLQVCALTGPQRSEPFLLLLRN